MALHYASLAMVEVLRSFSVTPEVHNRYLAQIQDNQSFNRRWMVPGPINMRHLVLLVDAEVATITNDFTAFQKL